MIVLGLAGYVLTGMQSWTALIPCFFGVLIGASGLLALAKPDLRKHAMHAAAGVALIGLAGTGRAATAIGTVFDGTAKRPEAVVAQTAMAVLCVVFLALCIKSFIDARRARNA